MTPADIDILLSEYRAATFAHLEPNDGTDDWIQRVNEAAGRMVVIAKEVGDLGSPAVDDFASLLGEEGELSIHAAHHILDFMHPGDVARGLALALIEQAATGESLDAICERTWLENWQAEQQNE
ncbi:MAG TPA: hypothetical protein VEZ11_03885 [Thermoanaerobaculia bacterium]|nr:hypothetical protein [Thermoanaerobaculia bacterium]